MSHSYLFEVFKSKFAALAAEAKDYISSGRDEIRIRFPDRTELVFTYHGERSWSLRTKDWR